MFLHFKEGAKVFFFAVFFVRFYRKNDLVFH